MSSSSGDGEGSRVLIPDSAKETIQTIREITGKQHSDEEIYTVLKECSMDPNETAQKLLYLDTFHEVKRKHGRRKETTGTGTQGRGARVSRGNRSSNHISSDSGGGRNASGRRENGVNQITERGHMPLQGSQKGKNNGISHSTKTPAAVANGTSALPNGSSKQGREPQIPVDGVSCDDKDALPVKIKKPEMAQQATVSEHATTVPTQALASGDYASALTGDQETSTSNLNQSSTFVAPASVSGVYSSASDPVLAPSISRHTGAVGAIKREVGCQHEANEINQIQVNKLVSLDIDSSKSKKTDSELPISVSANKAPTDSNVVEQINHSEPVEPSLPQVTSEVATVSDKDRSKLHPESNVSDGHHVTFPIHLKISEALKNGLTFGSFEASYGLGLRYENGNAGENSTHVVESSQGSDETAEEPSTSSQSVSSAVPEDNADQPQSTVFDKLQESDGKVSSVSDVKVEQSNQEIQLQAEGNQRLPIPNVPSYNFGFMPPLSASHLVQFDGLDAQARDASGMANFVSGNSPVPSGSSTPPIPSSAAAAPPQAVPLFRQPFPPNYFPYGHYLSPFFMPPVHQFLSPNGLPQQPSTGNIYMPPGAAAPGVKYPLPQFKSGTNAGNPTHITIPSGYGSYSSPLVGFNPIQAATSGASTTKEDLAASQLKENHMYSTGSLSDGSALWIPTPGQDLSSLQVNSLYNLPLHAQHVAFSPAQAGHGAFAGLYQPPQTIAAPSNVNPLLQQTQAVAASVETVGPPTAAYQQPQLAQLNWGANY